MSWTRNGLALAPLPHKDTPLQHLLSADDSFQDTPATYWAASIVWSESLKYVPCTSCHFCTITVSDLVASA
jgi:hypothetical protein